MAVPRSMWFLAAVSFLVSPASAVGQDAPRLAAGARVRVSSRVFGASYVVGTLTAVSPDTLQIALDSGAALVAVPFTAVRSLAVSVGQRSAGSRFQHGAGYGFLIGALGGVFIGFASGDDPQNTFIRFTAGEKAALAGIGLGGVGALLGGLVGLGSDADIWREADPSPVRLTLAPGAGRGMRVGLALSF